MRTARRGVQYTRTAVMVGCALWGLICPSAVVACASDGRYVMGTVLEITLCGTDPATTPDLFATLFTTATRLDALLTTFAADSPLSRLNAHAGSGPQPVSPCRCATGI